MTNEELRRTRKAVPFTQEQLAKAIGYSRQAVIHWENNIHPIPDDVASHILEVCVGVPIVKPKNVALTRDTIKYYGEMRRDGTTHAAIMDLWHRKNFVPTLEAQAGIAAAWPDILVTK